MRISKKNFTKAAQGSGGVQSVVAQKLNVTRGAITLYLQRNPDMQEVLNIEREKIIDVAENQLHAAAQRGEKWAVTKIMESIGKVRGYGYKQEIEHSGDLTTGILTELSNNYNELQSKRGSKPDTQSGGKK